MFSCCICILSIKLNIEQYIAFISIKVNLNMTNRIASLAALYWVKNFKYCNKHLSSFARHIDLVIKKILVDDIASQLDNIQQHNFVKRFKNLVIEKPEWFVESILQTIFKIIQIFFLKDRSSITTIKTVEILFLISNSSK